MVEEHKGLLSDQPADSESSRERRMAYIAELRQMFEETHGFAGPVVAFTEDEEDIAQVYHTMLAITLRPQMFTWHGTFHEVVSYLDGFWQGIRFHSNSGRRRGGWSDFSTWLAERYGTPRNVVWAGHIKSAYPNDAEALRQIPVLFATYLDEVSAGLWGNGERL